MSLTPAQGVAAEELDQVNDGPYDAANNPYGLARGGNSKGVFVGSLRNFVTLVRAVVGLADAAASDASGASSSAAAAGASAVAAAASADRAAMWDPTNYATKASPTFTGDPKAPTPAPGDSDTSIATTAFVQAETVRLAYALKNHFGG
ncbi:hypothetical protein [Aureimonas sp. ME7]|uniref:hypothetical protein n=1 Tax=Aureimonas sp. ME7 TaxID=2744252 RepID=UPI0015F93B3B|nr:hypothetical protein [Aureimonas sp. ME7]